MEKSSISAGKLHFAIACLLFFAMSCQKDIKKTVPAEVTESNTSAKGSHSNDFEQVNLVGDNSTYNPVRVDPRLINAWGMAFAPSGPDWISAEGTGLSVIYNTAGSDVRAPVAIPSPGSAGGGGHPTGVVFNSGTGFKLPNGNPARFIFDGLDGIISGWNSGNVALTMVDNSPHSVYTGLAIAADGVDTFLYAANFSKRRIEVYDNTWTRVFTKPFRDHDLPHGYSPFNIQNVGGNLYVMYAKVGHDGEEETGHGKGIVDIYKPNGRLIRRFVSADQLNAPWGVTMAPLAFWQDHQWDGDDDDDDDGYGHHHKNDHHGYHDNHHIKSVILVGNFGDGKINAYDQDGDFLGRLRQSNGKSIKIEGLWAISFAPATATSIDPNWLFFAAGPGDEEHGLFGYIKID
jgi:uncharacterized protein (TIGR03118 family)